MEKRITIFNLIDFIKFIYNDVISIEIDMSSNNAVLRTFSKIDSNYIFDLLKVFVGAKNAVISNVRIFNNPYDGYLIFYINF